MQKTIWTTELDGQSSLIQKFLINQNLQMKRMSKGYSASLIIGELQIKATMRNHLTPIRMAAIESLQTINAGEGVEKK